MMKKPIYKKWWFYLIVIVIIGAAFGSAGDEEDTTDSEPKVEEASTTSEVEKEEVEEDSAIDTSVFEYAKDVDLTDAIELNDHLTLFVHMSEDLSPGLAAQHVLNQTYDFIQQEDVEDAKTVSVNITQGENKIAMYTVDTTKFTPDDERPMAECVVEASEMEMMIDEVEEYGKTMELW